MRDAWILDVLADLKEFAGLNGMPLLEQQLERSRTVALAELSQSRALPKAHQALVAPAHTEAERCLGLTGFESQIMPVIVGEDRPALDLAARMQAHGYDIRAIRPPMVPRGTSRLRIPITLNTPAEVITEMFETLAKEMAK